MPLRTYPFFFLGFPAGIAFFGVLFAVLILWSLFWKVLGLWHAAQRGQIWWFLAILIFNTAGILEIIYIFFVARISLADLFINRIR